MTTNSDFQVEEFFILVIDESNPWTFKGSNLKGRGVVLDFAWS
jgi:hypothetical protein